jgi:hypothetical protein
MNLGEIAEKINLSKYTPEAECVSGLNQEQVNAKFEELASNPSIKNIRLGIAKFTEYEDHREYSQLNKAALLYDLEKNDTKLLDSLKDEYHKLTQMWDSLYYRHREFLVVDKKLELLEGELGLSPTLTNRKQWIDQKCQ